MIFDKSILSIGHKLADVDPTGILDSYSGTQTEQKSAQKTVIEAESEHYLRNSIEFQYM